MSGKDYSLIRKQSLGIKKKYNDKVKGKLTTNRFDLNIEKVLNTDFDLLDVSIQEDPNNSLLENRALRDVRNVLRQEQQPDFANEPTYSGYKTHEHVYEGSNVTVDDLVMSVLSLKIKHKLSESTCDDLFLLLTKVLPLPNKCPRNSKIFDNMTAPIENKIYCICSKCKEVINGVDLKQKTCKTCKTELDHFVVCDAQSQIKQLFSKDSYLKQVINSNNRGRSVSYQMHDAVDGDLYHNFMKDLNQHQLCISLNINTDGAPITTSTNHTLWPMVASVLELEPRFRENFKNLIFLGFWLCQNKPDYQLFTEKCLENLKNPLIFINTNEVMLRVHTFIADLPAKAAVLNAKQFNGIFGCLVCKHPSKYIKSNEDGHAHTQVYLPEPFELRSAQEFKLMSELAAKNDTILYGIKGTCCFTGLIDIPDQASLDFMHLVLQGHTRWLMKKFFESNLNCKYNMRKSILDFDKLITNIKSPHNLYRKVGSISQLCHWKSSELEHFLFHIALPVFSSSMASEYFYFLAVYICAIRLLYEPITDREDVDTADELLINYHRNLEKKFGRTSYNYTIHAHLHLAQQVRLHGPLKSHSQFVFEGALYVIQGFLHGSRGFLNQIIKQLSLSRSFCLNLEPEKFNSRDLFEFCYNNVNNNRVHDLNKPQLLPPFETKLIIEPCLSLFIKQLSLPASFNESLQTSTRAIFNSTVYHSINYNQKKNSNSYTVNFLHNKLESFGEISFFMEFEQSIYCFINKFEMEDNVMDVLPVPGVINSTLPGSETQEESNYFYNSTGKLLSRFFTVSTEKHKTHLVLVPARDVKYKCVVVDVNNCRFFSRVKYEFQHD